MNEEQKAKYVAQIFSQVEEMFVRIRDHISTRAQEFISKKIEREKNIFFKLLFVKAEKIQKTNVEAKQATRSAPSVDERYFTKKTFNPDNF